jgi:uncharacterized protein YyaL (SSP411 family)
MKKILFFILLTAGILLAEVNWQPDYASAKAQAQKSGKPMMVLLVSHTCRWCRKLENRTLQNPEVSEFINSRFVPVLVYRGDGGFPDFIHASMVPTTFFLTPDEKMIIHPVTGYWEPSDYMSDLKLALKKFKKLQSPH